MTAVTVVERKEVQGNLGMEVVKCTATDGYTFKSRFGTVIAAFGNSQSRAGSYCSWSGGTVTYNCASASVDSVCLFIIGY